MNYSEIIAIIENQYDPTTSGGCTGFSGTIGSPFKESCHETQIRGTWYYVELIYNSVGKVVVRKIISKDLLIRQKKLEKLNEMVNQCG